MGYEIEVLKMNLEGTAKIQEIDEIQKKFQDYAPLYALKEI